MLHKITRVTPASPVLGRRPRLLISLALTKQWVVRPFGSAQGRLLQKTQEDGAASEEMAHAGVVEGRPPRLSPKDLHELAVTWGYSGWRLRLARRNVHMSLLDLASGRHFYVAAEVHHPRDAARRDCGQARGTWFLCAHGSDVEKRCVLVP
jgi:hypothetical protein